MMALSALCAQLDFTSAFFEEVRNVVMLSYPSMDKCWWSKSSMILPISTKSKVTWLPVSLWRCFLYCNSTYVLDDWESSETNQCQISHDTSSCGMFLLLTNHTTVLQNTESHVRLFDIIFSHDRSCGSSCHKELTFFMTVEEICRAIISVSWH